MFNTILLALDGSEAAERAIPLAEDLARHDGGRIIVGHVRELLAGRGGTQTLNANEDDLESSIRAHATRLAESGIETSVEIATSVMGGPAHALAEMATREHADVIVAGTRGHAPVAGLLLGSVTQRLLHVAPCPVLVMPAVAKMAETTVSR
jgi:nucleotide-binding universal stress UspA family protein